MLNKLINQQVMQVLSKGLDGAELRHSVIANNIANAETPNYKRILVSFEEELKEALGRSQNLKGNTTNSKHIPINFNPLEETKPKLYNTKEQSLRNDKNNVDVNVEMANMAMNSLKYNALVSLLTRHITMVKMSMRSRM